MRNEDARALLRDAKRLAGELEAMVHTPDGPKPLLVFARDRLFVQADRTIPGTGVEGGNRSKGDHADPTAARAMDETAERVAANLRAARKELDDAVVTAVAKLERAVKLAQAAAITKYHAPRNNPGCRNCARVVTHEGKPHPEAWQPVKARGLCGWCYRFEYGDGPERPGYAVPPVYELVAWHLDHLGTEPPRTLVRDLMPNEHRAREEVRRRIASRGAHPARACGASYTHRGVEAACELPAGHHGDHQAGARTWSADQFHAGPRPEFERDLHAVAAPES